MIKSEEKLKNLSSLFGKDNPAFIMQAIHMLREEEPFEGAVGLLASCYEEDHGVMVNKAIESFMNDLKDKAVRTEIVQELRKNHDQRTVTMLVSSCWQSGMDYSEYAFDFAQVFMNSDYSTAVECLTVIEEAIPTMKDREKRRIVDYINEKAPGQPRARKALSAELISRLELL